MKKLIALAVMLLVAGSAWASMPRSNKVDCNVNGVHKWVKSVDACNALGGKVIKPESKKK